MAKKSQSAPGGVRLQFGAALRKLGGLADALAGSGALTEMTGAEFITYGAEQLALACIESKDASAARLSALKSAVASATEQTQSTGTGEPVVYVKVHDADDAALTQVETLLSQCKSALESLRIAAGEGDGGPATAKGIETLISRRPRSGDPLRDAYADDEDDDLDADVFDDFDEPSRRALALRQENEAYGEDDADDLDAHVAALVPGHQPAPAPRARVTSRRQDPDPEPPARPARVQAPAVRTSRAKLRPGDKDPLTGLVVQAPPPKRKLAQNAHGIISGANPAAVANAIARGDSGVPRLQTARSSRRG